MFDFHKLDDFIARGARPQGRGPVALILTEDFYDLGGTLTHHLRLGFDHCIVISCALPPVPDELRADVTMVYHDIFAAGAAADVVNRCMAALDGRWVLVCYNGENLYFPFCETRSIADVTQFAAQDKRSTIPIWVIDTYPAQMPQAGHNVPPDGQFIDARGYHGTPRWNRDEGCEYERQLDMFGGLKWRFRDHVPFDRRRIDRVALFQARAGLTVADDFTMSDQDYNTYQGTWHNGLTAALVSHRTAKSLSQNPASRSEITQLSWSHSVQWSGQSRKLLDLGLIEAGQWF